MKKLNKTKKNFIRWLEYLLEDLLDGWETSGYSTPDGRGTEVFILISQIKRTSECQEVVKKCEEVQKKSKDDITKEDLSGLLGILKNEVNAT